MPGIQAKMERDNWIHSCPPPFTPQTPQFTKEFENHVAEFFSAELPKAQEKHNQELYFHQCVAIYKTKILHVLSVYSP